MEPGQSQSALGSESRKLILLRHGQTTYNATGRMQGQMDTDLSATGEAQAAAVAGFFAGGPVVSDSGVDAGADSGASTVGTGRTHAITRIIASDLKRAYDTAGAVGDLLGLDVAKDTRLRETLLGEWQGMSHTEVDVEFPGARYRWRNDPEWAPPGGESRVAVAERMRSVVDELIATDVDWPGSTTMLVAHGGSIAALTASLTGVPLSHFFLFNGLRNTAWVELSTSIRPDGTLGWNLDAFNAELTPTPVR